MNLDNLYLASKKIAGHMGEDLLHHVLAKNNFFQGKKIENIDGYIYTILRNEYRNQDSSFNKQFKSVKILIEDEENETNGYCIDRVHKILLELKIEGYRREVNVFTECYFNGGRHKVSKKTGIDWKVIDKICNFVKEELIKRYD